MALNKITFMLLSLSLPFISSFQSSLISENSPSHPHTCCSQGFSDSSWLQNHWGLLKTNLLDPTQYLWLDRSEHDPRTCISNKFPADTTGLGIHLEKDFLHPQCWLVVEWQEMVLTHTCKLRPFQAHPLMVTWDVFQWLNKDALSQNSCGPLLVAKEMK